MRDSDKIRHVLTAKEAIKIAATFQHVPKFYDPIMTSVLVIMKFIDTKVL